MKTTVRGICKISITNSTESPHAFFHTICYCS
uniref:Uncharacterized protein n=1 Tax=Arundo donax TaxID=35708 RepID=A0A0A9GTF4_ARUDO